MGVQVGDRNTQIIYAYNRLTWTDGVAPAPLTSVSGMIDSPYRGLSAFEEQDAPFFFGREGDAAQVLKRMSQLANEAGLLVVSGISGAGKSSLMRAGVLPRLRGIGLASMPEAASWPCLIFAPSHAPLDELAIRVGALAGTDSGTIRRSLHTDPSGFALTARQAALTQSDRRGETGNVSPPESHRLLLIIDQFEQLFTQCSDDEQRQAFITALHAAASPSGPGRAPAAMIVLAVRADFEARCAEYQQLADPIRDRFLLTSMTGRQLRMAITEPAKNAGSSVDADLAEVLLREISSQQRSPDATSRPGAIFGAGVLPLLSHALDQAWRNRAGDVLTLADYERVGGIERAIADSAQRAFNGLSRAQQAVARQVFTRLTATSSDGVDTADRVARAELTEGRSRAAAGDVEAVLEAFAAARLLTLAAGTVDISHEVLLTAWPLLRDTWLTETHSDRIIRTRLHDAAADWERHSHNPSYLYSGSLLAAATETAARINADPARHPPLTSTERSFLRVSDRTRRRRARQRQGTLAVLTALVVGLSAVAIVAIRARQEAVQQLDNAVSGQLAAQSEALGDTNPVVARLESLAAWRLDPSSAQARYAMLNAATLPGTALLTSDGTVALSPDGKILAVSYGGVVQLWDIANRKQLGASLKAPYGGADALAFSSDGRTLAVAGYDTGDAGNIVDLWDMATRRLEGHLAVDNLLQVNMMAFGPGAKTLAVAAIAGQAAVLDLATGRQSAVINTGQVLASAFSPDGTTLAVSGDGGVTRLWNLTTGRLAGGPLHTGVAEALAFSPDGRTLAAGGYGGTARLWDITTGKQTGPVFGNAAIQSLAFSPDGKILATGDYYGAVQLWDVATGSELCDPLTGHTGAVIWAAFSSDGKTLITNSSDGTTRLWNVTVATNDPDGGPQLFPSRVGAPVSLAFSPDGMTLAIAAYSGTVQLWDMAGGNPVSRHLDTTAATSVAFSPDGKTLAIGTWDGTVQLWSTATGRRIASVRGSVEIGSVAFSPDGKTLAAADTQGAQLWDVASRKPTWLFRIPNGPVSVAFSPDGKTLAAIASGDTVRLWQVATRKPINGPLAAATAINAIAFSPDGKTLGTGAYNGTMQLWDVATGQKDGAPFTGNTGPVEAVAFSPDGKTLATGAEDGTARLWDVATRQEIGTPFLDQSTVSSVVFSPDGKTLVTVASSSDSTTSTGTMQLWNVSYLDNVVSSLCASAGRSLTRAEWALYVQGPPYQNLCA